LIYTLICLNCFDDVQFTHRGTLKGNVHTAKECFDRMESKITDTLQPQVKSAVEQEAKLPECIREMIHNVRNYRK